MKKLLLIVLCKIFSQLGRSCPRHRFGFYYFCTYLRGNRGVALSISQQMIIIVQRMEKLSPQRQGKLNIFDSYVLESDSGMESTEPQY